MTDNAPADLASFVDPLKEWFTWKWVMAVIGLAAIFFGCFTGSCVAIVTGHWLILIVIILFYIILVVLFLLYARTPNVLEENWRGLLFYIMMKIGLNSFSKYSRKLKKWWVSNFSGLKEMDEETGLCLERTNQDMI
jgi:uncharacterized membrane protein YoaK (UPF0700 family)